MSTNANRFVPPYYMIVDSTGTPISGAMLYFFQSMTTTPQNTYADPGLMEPNPNPVIANGFGLFPSIFLEDAAYNVVAVAPGGSLDSPIWNADPVYGASTQPIAPGQVLGNNTESPVAPFGVSLSDMLDTIDNTTGDILVRGSAAWQTLPPSTAGLVLTTEGPGQIPSWSNSGQYQSGNFAVDTGVVNAYVAALTPPLGTGQPGMPIRLQIANTNTLQACTFDPGSGALPIQTLDGQEPDIGGLPAGAIVEFFLNSGETAYQFQRILRRFYSTGLALATGGTIGPASHGLGGIPSNVWGTLVCVTGNAGYAAGQEVVLPSLFVDASGDARGFNIYKTATEIAAVCAGNNPTLLNPSSGALTVITLADWTLSLTAEL